MDIEDVINFTERKDIFRNVDLEKLEDFVKFIAEQILLLKMNINKHLF